MAEQRIGVVFNEFAQVAVSIDEHANGPRLKLEDLKTGHVRYLDALEVETVAWLSEKRIETLLDPSFERWGEDTDQAPAR